MTKDFFQALACPLDHQPLLREGMTLRCAAGHCFDIASQGYTNLLPVQKKRSLDPGDSKEMVAARRRFLNAGHYAPIATAVSSAALAELHSGESVSCLDAGCGEGYYLRQLSAAADRNSQALTLIGLDISKWAVLAAAKQDKEPTWVVGSNANIPALAGSLDRILCMFGFPVYAEFSRVLKPGGVLLRVDAGPDHLRELREIIYPTVKPSRSAPAQTPEGFAGLATEAVCYSVDIVGAEQIGDLLTMTPHLYRASAEGRAMAAELTKISLTVDVLITRLKKLPANTH